MSEYKFSDSSVSAPLVGGLYYHLATPERWRQLIGHQAQVGQMVGENGDFYVQLRGREHPRLLPVLLRGDQKQLADAALMRDRYVDTKPDDDDWLSGDSLLEGSLMFDRQMLFHDLLRYGGHDLRDRPFAFRYALLNQLANEALAAGQWRADWCVAPLVLKPALNDFAGNGGLVVRSSYGQRSVEFLVLKRLDSRYPAPRRRTWIKDSRWRLDPRPIMPTRVSGAIS